MLSFLEMVSHAFPLCMDDGILCSLLFSSSPYSDDSVAWLDPLVFFIFFGVFASRLAMASFNFLLTELSMPSSTFELPSSWATI